MNEMLPNMRSVIIAVVANDHIIRQCIGGGVFNAGIFKSSTCLKRHHPS